MSLTENLIRRDLGRIADAVGVIVARRLVEDEEDMEAVLMRWVGKEEELVRRETERVWRAIEISGTAPSLQEPIAVGTLFLLFRRAGAPGMDNFTLDKTMVKD